MDPDLKLALDAWRKLVVENDKLRQEVEQLKKAGSRDEPEVWYRRKKVDYCED